MAQSVFFQPAPGRVQHFYWGCRIRDRYDFLYLYGPYQDYQGAMALSDGRGCLHKGYLPTLTEVRQAAEGKATSMAAMYEGVGVVQVMSALEYLASARPRGDDWLPFR